MSFKIRQTQVRIEIFKFVLTLCQYYAGDAVSDTIRAYCSLEQIVRQPMQEAATLGRRQMLEGWTWNNDR